MAGLRKAIRKAIKFDKEARERGPVDQGLTDNWNEMSGKEQSHVRWLAFGSRGGSCTPTAIIALGGNPDRAYYDNRQPVIPATEDFIRQSDLIISPRVLIMRHGPKNL